MRQRTATAIASALATITLETIDGSPTCTVTSVPDVSTEAGTTTATNCRQSERCVLTGERCAARLDDPDVLICCAPEDACVQRGRNAFCRRADDVPRRWDGTVRTCEGNQESALVSQRG